MEDILEFYARPYDVKFPVVCMDESSVQLIGEVHEPIPAAPGHPVLMDDEYVRKGVASIFMEVEPLGGKRKVKITERRTRIDWAHFIKEMLEERYADAEKVVLVMDNQPFQGHSHFFLAARIFAVETCGVFLQLFRFGCGFLGPRGCF